MEVYSLLISLFLFSITSSFILYYIHQNNILLVGISFTFYLSVFYTLFFILRISLDYLDHIVYYSFLSITCFSLGVLFLLNKITRLHEKILSFPLLQKNVLIFVTVILFSLLFQKGFYEILQRSLFFEDNILYFLCAFLLFTIITFNMFYFLREYKNIIGSILFFILFWYQVNQIQEINNFLEEPQKMIILGAIGFVILWVIYADFIKESKRRNIVYHLILSFFLFLVSSNINYHMQHQKIHTLKKSQISFTKPWITNLNEAIKQSKANKKLLFIYIWADWCQPCHKLHKDFFNTSLFKDFIKEHNLLPFAIDFSSTTKENEKMYDLFLIQSVPSFIITSYNLDPYKLHYGYRNLDSLLFKLKRNIEYLKR